MSATCVSVTSLSAPKPSTAASLSNFKSLLTVTAVEALRSIVASPSIRNTPLDDCCTKEAASPKVSLFVLLRVRPVPSVCVNVVSLSAPNDRTELSDISLRSSPTDKSAATPAPPATVKAPVVALELAVVAVTATTPPLDIVIALVSLADPIDPASSITIVPVVSVPSRKASLNNKEEVPMSNVLVVLGVTSVALTTKSCAGPNTVTGPPSADVPSVYDH